MTLNTYKVKELFYTIQGEGYHTGRAAVFCRMAGCNLWTGRKQDRIHAVCKFCDTDFIGMDGENGGKYTAEKLADTICALWPDKTTNPFLVITGGEPLLQVDEILIGQLHKRGIFIAIETNGTLAAPPGIDWICVSPKADSQLVQVTGHELKLVYPQKENNPKNFEDLDFLHFYIQPLEDEQWAENTRVSVAFVKNNPRWKLSAQTHKYLNIP